MLGSLSVVTFMQAQSAGLTRATERLVDVGGQVSQIAVGWTATDRKHEAECGRDDPDTILHNTNSHKQDKINNVNYSQRTRPK